MRIFGGNFLFMKHYTKTYLTFDQQIELLKSRGLVVENEIKAARFLASLGYYRFTGYAIPFMSDREHFMAGTRFEDVVTVCRYDSELRDILFNGVEAVELEFRTRFAHSFSKRYGPLGYKDRHNFNDPVKHDDALDKVDEAIDSSSDLCVKHFKREYYPGEIPIWAIVEVLSFGTLVSMYNNLAEQGRKDISRPYGIKWDILGSYMQHLSVVRNICAHHSRLFDRKFYNFRPLSEWRSTDNPISDTRALFFQCALIYRILRCAASCFFDRNVWRDRIAEHFARAPVPNGINLCEAMGIPISPDCFWV